MRSLFLVLTGVVCGLLVPTLARAGGPCYGTPFGAPIIGPPAYSSGPIISSSYSTPVVEQVIVKEHVKEVVAPVAVPVVVPATVFQYLPALTPGAQLTSNVSTAGAAASVAAQPATQATVAQPPPPVATQATQQVQTAQPAQAAVPQTVQQTVQTTEQVDTLLRMRLDAILREKQFGIAADAPPPLYDPEQPPQASPPQQAPLQQAQPAQQDQLMPGSESRAGKAALESRAMQVVGQSCLVCHNPKSDRGGVTLVNDQNQWAPTKDGVSLDGDTIAKSVESGRMPKLNATLKNQPLTPPQKNDLIAWLRGQ